MALTITLVCDTCGADLTEAPTDNAFRLALGSECVPNWNGVLEHTTDCDPIPDDLHFCDWPCLYKFVDQRRTR